MRYTPLEEMKKQCVFCEYQQRNIIIAETEHFIVTPTYGQISNGGHTLIIPKTHYLCLGAMPDAVMDEFATLKKKMQEITTNVYKKPIQFEHGIIGQSIPHAHLQMIPLAIDLFSRVSADFEDFTVLPSVSDLQYVHRTRGVYLFYENQSGEQYCFLIDHKPQYLRIAAAEEAGVPERADWKVWRETNGALDDALIAETVDKLKRFF